MSDVPTLPLPNLPIAVRPATVADLPFIDALQKRHANAVGWMPRAQLEGKVAAGGVLIAEEMRGEMQNDECRMMNKELAANDPSLLSSPFCIPHSSFITPPSPLGYLISSDRYFKRDDVGIVYQMNVVPGAQRGLVGATLLRAAFDRAAYGCRLFCCWCAQDLEANKFWEAMGFVPLAFRAGGEAKGRGGSPRVHIFWQRRIRAGDDVTPYWFPAKTDAGALREDRLVLPIPPGKHWAEAMPVIVPAGGESGELREARCEEQKSKRLTDATTRGKGKKAAAPMRARAQFGPPSADAMPPVEVPTPAVKAPRAKRKADPKLVAMARELRDRWLERVNVEGLMSPAGKYDVSRSVEGTNHRAAATLLPARSTPILVAA